MKSLFICILASAQAAMATTSLFTADFGGLYTPDVTPGDGKANLAGQQGYAINDLPTAGPALPDQLSFLVNPGGGTDYWGALGGAVSYPNIRNVELSQTVSLTMDASSLDLDFAIIESSPTPAPPAPNYNYQDSFGWTFRTGGVNGTDVFRIILEGIGPTGTRRISLAVAGGTPFPLSPSLGAVTSSLAAPASHHLRLDFNNNGTDALITGSIGGGAISVTIPGQAFTTIDSFITDFDVTAATPSNTNVGDNFIMFDNLFIIPEPSTTLVLGLVGALGLTRRRRTA